MAGVTDDFSEIAKRFPIDVTKREIKGFGNFSNEAALKALNQGLFDHLQSIVKSNPELTSAEVALLKRSIKIGESIQLPSQDPKKDIRFYPLIAQMLKQALSDMTDEAQKMKLITEVKAQTDLLTMYTLLLDELSSAKMQKHQESIPDGEESAFKFAAEMKDKYDDKYEKLIWQYAHTLISTTHRGQLLSQVRVSDSEPALKNIKYP